MRRFTLLLDTITIPAKIDAEIDPTGLIVLLHGWGANAMDLAGLVPLLNLPDFTFIFPNAPLPHPQVEGGLMWYDFQYDNQGYASSRQLLYDWLLALPKTTQIPLSKTLIAGFSQGAAMALDVGLTLPVAGIVAMSGYLHPIEHPLNSPLPPVFILHGTEDAVVPLAMAESAQQQLQNLGVPLEYQSFKMGHEIRPEVIQHFKAFVLQSLPRSQ